MSILHDIAKYGKIGDASDLIEWLNSEESNDFYADYHLENYKHVYEPNPRGINFDIVVKANQELRKPLEISDFVRGPEPEAPNYTDSVEAFNDYVEGIDGKAPKEEVINYHYVTRERNYSKLLEAWENWTPLFDGWERLTGTTFIKDGHKVTITKTNRALKLANGSILRLTTVEDFIRICKSHNIDLLKEVEV